MPRIYLQTYGNVRIQSARNPDLTINVNQPVGQFISIPMNQRNQIRVSVERDNQFKILSPNGITFSFDIGYANFPLASAMFEPVVERERFIFGNEQLHINNNWRITTGPTEYVLNNRINQLRIHENRNILFNVIIDRGVQEPDRIAIRLRPFNFATMFFGANQLLQIRYNGHYLINVFHRMQRLHINEPNQFALVPFHDPHFLGMFQFMEANRLAAIEAPPENIREFNQLFQQALQALYPQHVVAEFIRQLANVDQDELIDLQAAPQNAYQDVLRDFYDNL